MTYYQTLRRLLAALVFLSASASIAQAYEIQSLRFAYPEQARSQLARSIQGQVLVQNLTEQTLILSSRPYRQNGAIFQLDLERATLRPGERRYIAYKGQIGRAGKWAIELPISVTSARGKVPQDSQILPLYYWVKVEPRRRVLQAQASSYEQLFIELGSQRIEGMGRVFSAAPMRSDLTRSKSYQENRQPALRRWASRPDRSLSRRVPTDSGGGRRDLSPEPDTNLLREELDADRSLGEESSRELSRGVVTASGEFSYMGIDAVLYPAWGWRARAWVKPNGGNWSIAAEDWVEWNGRWTLSFNQPANSTVQFQYVAFNRYYTPQTNDGETYRWVGPERGALVANHDEGSWWADTNTGNGRGLGELYQDAMELWSGIYWQGNINPLRSESIKVIFPNLTFECSSGNIWSCANTGGNIWLIPTHATNRETIIHELGHQLNYEYWNNERPEGTGGSHSLAGCYTAGGALMEGFANYMVGWVKTNRDDNSNMKRSLEDPAAIDACTTTNINEGYVGATFWDLHDKVADGDDSIWFVHRGAVPSLFLNAGMKQKMSDYRETFRNAANAEHRSIVDAIFEMNHTK